MKNCKDCGHSVSDTAKNCPKCGADLREWYEKIPRGAWLIFAVIAIVIGSKFSKSDKPQDSKNEETITETPASQNALDSIHNALKECQHKYSNSQNEIQQSDAYKEAIGSTQHIMFSYKGHFENWEGKIISISTLEKGGNTLILKITSSQNNSKITFKTPCSILGSCGIKEDNPVYDMVRGLKEGDDVLFSGQFLTDENGDIVEDSKTELGGILLPEFSVLFTSISLANTK